MRLSGGRFALAATLRVQPNGHPLHLLSEDGSRIITSFGGGSGGSEPLPWWMNLRFITASADGGLWSGSAHEYVLEKWDEDGQLVARLVRNVEWFPPASGPPRLPREERPEARIGGLLEDARGLLWVLITVAAENWGPLPPAAVAPSGETRTSPEQFEALFDTIVEVIDPASGDAVASTRFDGLLNVGGPDVAYKYAPVGLEPAYRLYRLRLTEAP